MRAEIPLETLSLCENKSNPLLIAGLLGALETEKAFATLCKGKLSTIRPFFGKAFVEPELCLYEDIQAHIEVLITRFETEPADNRDLEPFYDIVSKDSARLSIAENNRDILALITNHIENAGRRHFFKIPANAP